MHRKWLFPKSFIKNDEIYNKKEPVIQLDGTYTLTVDSIIAKSNTVRSSFNCLYVKNLGYKTEKNVFSILKIGGIINQRFYFGYDDDFTKEDVIFFVYNIFKNKFSNNPSIFNTNVAVICHNKDLNIPLKCQISTSNC